MIMYCIGGRSPPQHEWSCLGFAEDEGDQTRHFLLAKPCTAEYRGGTNFMADKSIEEKVKDIIVEQLGVNPEQVTPQASFIEDLGADSLDIVELVMAFEEEFGVEVPDEDAEKLQTVGDVINYIKERAKPKEGESGS